MVVRVEIAVGDSGALHGHPHGQSTDAKSGSYRFTIESRTFEVGPGHAFVIPLDAEHGCRCPDAGSLTYRFAPRRADLL